MSVRLIDPARIYLLSGSYIQLGSGSVANDFSVSGTLYSIGGAVLYGPLVVSSSAFFSGSVNFTDLVVSGNLTVLGTQTILNTDTLQVKDKLIELAVVSSPTDVTAQGAGFLITGSTNKTFTWNTNGFQSSENLDLLAGHEYTINGLSVLNSTTLGNVIKSSSLQTLGIITSGTWNATPITGSFSGTLKGIADTASIASSSANIVTAGTFTGNNYIFSLVSASTGFQSKYIELSNTSDAKIRFTNTSASGKPYDLYTDGIGQLTIKDINAGINRLTIKANGDISASGVISASSFYGAIPSASWAVCASYALTTLSTDVTASRAVSASYADRINGANVYDVVYSASNATSASYALTSRLILSSPTGTLLVGWIETSSVSISSSYASTASHLDNQYWKIDNNGMLVPTISNTYDIGTVSLLPRIIYANTSVISQGSVSSSLGYQISDGGINSKIYNSASLVLETITNNEILFRTNGSSRWGITNAGTLYGSIDNTYDIGTTTNFRPKFVYIASGTVIGSDPGSTAGVRIGTDFNVDNLLYVDSTNNLIFIGNSTGSINVYDTTQIDSLNNSQLLGLVRAGNNGNGAYLSLYKSRGTSLSLTGSVQSNDELGIVKFVGMPTNGIYSVGSTISSIVNNVYSDRISSKLIFSTVDSSTSGTIQNRIIIDDIGVVTIKSSSVSNSPLIVSGNILSTNKFVASSSTAITEFDSNAIGTFSDNVFNIKTNNVNKWAVSSSGHLSAVSDNAYDIGAPALNRPRNLYVAGDIIARSFTGSFTGTISFATTSISATTSSYGMNNFVVFADPGGTETLRVSGTIRSSNIRLGMSGTLSGYGGVEIASVHTSSLQMAANSYGLYGVNGTTLFWQVTSSGHLLPGTDITYDVGSSTSRVRNLYVGSGSINRLVVGNTTILGVSTITETNNPNLIISDGNTLGSRLMEIKGPSVAADSLIEIRNTSGQFTINHSGSAGQGSITIQTNSTNRLYISGSGMIGLNTTTPKSTLHVVGNGSTTQKHIVFIDPSTTLIPWNSYDGTSTTALHIQTGTSASLLLAPNSTGDAQLIIGTGSLRISTNAIPGTNAGTLGMTMANGSIVIPNSVTATSITGSYTGSMVGQLTFNSNILAAVDNAYDIGQNALNRPRNVYVAGEIVATRMTGSISGTITYATMSATADTASFVTWVNIFNKPVGIVTSSTQFKTLTDSFSGSFTGSHVGTLTGNASTATTLQTARLINGTSFDGSSNIIITGSYTTLSNIPVGIVSSSGQVVYTSLSSIPIGIVSSSTQTSGWSAATLTTARLINGTSFNGSANIIITGSYTTLDSIPVGIVSSSTQASGWTVSSANTLTTARLINGTSFNGSANIIITASYSTLTNIPIGIVSSSTQTSGWSAATLTTARLINGTSFDGSSNIIITGSYSTLSSIPTGIVSSSLQIPALLPAGTVSSSGQVVYTGLSSIPVGIVSASMQFKLLTDPFSGSFTGSHIGTLTGNASTATSLQTARLINGTSFDGTSNIIITGSYTTLTNIPIGLVSSSGQIPSLLPIGTVSSSTQVTYTGLSSIPVGIVSSSTQFKLLTDSFSGSFTGSHVGTLTGNASTATTLQTARLINGTSFNGSSNIIITGSYSTLSNIPVGIVSSSTQTIALLPAGTVSSSGQVVYTSLSSIPVGIVSSSTQASTWGVDNAAHLTTARLINGTSFDGTANIIITGSYTTLSNIPVGILSSSVQLTASLPAGTVSSSGQVSYTGLSSIPVGIVSSSTQATGWTVTTATGNAGTATTLQTARLINGTSFNGSANIITTASYSTLDSIPIGIVSSSTQATGWTVTTATGNAGTATTLQTARLINGTSFNGSANIIITSSYSTLDNIPIGIVSSSTQASGWSVSSAATLTTARLINGTSFNGSANIIITGSYSTLSNIPTGIVSSSTQTTTWSAATLTTARLINGTSFDGSSNIIITGSYTTLSNIPVGIVSSSGQVVYTSLSSIPTGIVSSSAQITTWTSATSSLALSVSGTAGRVLFNSAANVTTTSGSLLFDGSNLTVGGQLNASTKSFLIEHRSKPGKKLMYGVVEGPEHSVFIRGVLAGTNIIQLPEEWSWLIDYTSITVQLTPKGSYQKLYVKDININNNSIIIGNENLLKKNINCFYFIQATRKDVPPLNTVI